MQITFKNILITRQDVLTILHDFDQRYPDTNQYEDWLEKDNDIYALHYAGRPYPPKCILSEVSGLPTTELHGGEPTNRVFRRLGFEVERKK